MKSLIILTFVLVVGALADINSCPKNLPRNKYLSTYNTSCLQIVPTSKTWKDARKYCQNYHGDLVTINNFHKEVYVMSQLRSQNRHHKTWIGATDQVSEGNWKWVTGESVNGHYGNWKQGQGPTNHGFLFSGATWEDCALIDYNDNGKWNDYLCDSRLFKYQFICEYAQITTTTSTTTSTITQTTPTTKTTTTTTKPTTPKKTTTATTTKATTTKASTTKALTTKSTTTPTTTTKIPTTSTTTIHTSTTTTTQRPTTTKTITTTVSPSTVKRTPTRETTTSKLPTTKRISTARTTTETTNKPKMTHIVLTSSEVPAQVKTTKISTSISKQQQTTGLPSLRVSKKHPSSGKPSTTRPKSKPNVVSSSVPSSTRSKLSSPALNPGKFSNPAFTGKPKGSSLLGHPSGQHSANKSGKGLKGYVIGILVAGVVLLGGAALVIFFVIRRRRMNIMIPNNHVDNPLYVDEHTPPTFNTTETEDKQTIQSFSDSSEA